MFAGFDRLAALDQFKCAQSSQGVFETAATGAITGVFAELPRRHAFGINGQQPDSVFTIFDRILRFTNSISFGLIMGFENAAYFGQPGIGILTELDISWKSRTFRFGGCAPGTPLRLPGRWFRRLFMKGKTVSGHKNPRTYYSNHYDVSDYFRLFHSQ